MLNRSLEGTLRKYILGALGEIARLDVEERVIAQPEMFDALALAEQALIDDYLDDTLPGTERARFERQLSAVTGLRQKVQFARNLRVHAASVDAGRTADRTGATDDPSRWLLPFVGRVVSWTSPARAYRPAWAAAMAAVLVALVAGSAWLATGRARLQGQLDQLRAARHEDQRQLEGLSGTVRKLEARLDAEQRERARVEGAAAAPPRPTATPPPAVPTFLLATGVLRSQGSMARISVPSGAQIVRLRLAVAERARGEYRAVLYDAEGEELWAISRLHADPDGSSVTLVVPADVLPHGDYQIALRATGSEPEAQRSLTSAFRVTAR